MTRRKQQSKSVQARAIVRRPPHRDHHPRAAAHPQPPPVPPTPQPLVGGYRRIDEPERLALYEALRRERDPAEYDVTTWFRTPSPRWNVPCIYCCAETGEPCKGKRGNPLNSFHSERREAFEQYRDRRFRTAKPRY